MRLSPVAPFILISVCVSVGVCVPLGKRPHRPKRWHIALFPAEHIMMVSHNITRTSHSQSLRARAWCVQPVHSRAARTQTRTTYSHPLMTPHGTGARGGWSLCVRCARAPATKPGTYRLNSPREHLFNCMCLSVSVRVCVCECAGARTPS